MDLETRLSKLMHKRFPDHEKNDHISSGLCAMASNRPLKLSCESQRLMNQSTAGSVKQLSGPYPFYVRPRDPGGFGFRARLL